MALVNKTHALPAGWEDALQIESFTNTVGDEVQVEAKAYDAYLELKDDLEADGVYVDDVWVGNNPGVGVEEMPTLAAMVSPNPTSGMVSIETNAAEGEVVVYDLFGRKVASVTLCEGRANIDLSNCAKGVYMAKISSEVGLATIKLVKE